GVNVRGKWQVGRGGGPRGGRGGSVRGDPAGAGGGRDRPPTAPPPRVPSQKRATPAGIIRANPRLSRCVYRRAAPDRSIREVIVRASAGLWTRVATNTPNPAPVAPRPTR